MATIAPCARPCSSPPHTATSTWASSSPTHASTASCRRGPRKRPRALRRRIRHASRQPRFARPESQQHERRIRAADLFAAVLLSRPPRPEVFPESLVDSVWASFCFAARGGGDALWSRLSRRPRHCPRCRVFFEGGPPGGCFQGSGCAFAPVKRGAAPAPRAHDRRNASQRRRRGGVRAHGTLGGTQARRRCRSLA